jgi:hypothetical protein
MATVTSFSSWAALEITIEVLLEEIGLSLEPTGTAGRLVTYDCADNELVFLDSPVRAK